MTVTEGMIDEGVGSAIRGKVAPVPTTARVRRARAPRRGVAATESANAGPGTDPIVRSLFKPAPGLIYLDTATYGLPPLPTVEVMERALPAGSRAPPTGSRTGTSRRTAAGVTSRP